MARSSSRSTEMATRTPGRTPRPLPLAIVLSLLAIPGVYLALRSMADRAHEQEAGLPWADDRIASDPLLLAASLGGVLLAGLAGGLAGTLLLRRSRSRALVAGTTTLVAWIAGTVGIALATAFHGMPVTLLVVCIDSCSPELSIGTIDGIGNALRSSFAAAAVPFFVSIPVAFGLLLGSHLVSRLHRSRAAAIARFALIPLLLITAVSVAGAGTLAFVAGVAGVIGALLLGDRFGGTAGHAGTAAVLETLLGAAGGLALAGFAPLFALPIALLLVLGVTAWLSVTLPPEPVAP